MTIQPTTARTLLATFGKSRLRRIYATARTCGQHDVQRLAGRLKRASSADRPAVAAALTDAEVATLLKGARRAMIREALNLS